MGIGTGFRLRSDRRGSVLAVVAVSLVALVSVVALAVDLGMLYAARGEAQRAADSAALAGASAFLDYDPGLKPVEATQEAEARALDYATRHTVMKGQIVTGEVTPEILLNEQKVRVTIRRNAVPLFFARVFGIESSGVVASAAAEVVNAGSTTCVKPFALPDMILNANPATDIYQGGDTPIWDFDVHLRPSAFPDAASSPHCSGSGASLECEPEVWEFEPGSYGDGENGYGSIARDEVPDFAGNTYDKDVGRRVPLKINFPTDGPVSSFWFPWRLPGSSGVKDFKEALKGCVDQASVGQDVEIDGVESENGLFPKPTYDAIIDLIDNGNGVSAPDRNATWNEETRQVESPVYGDNWRASPRVIKVALFNPDDMRQGNNTMEFVNIATFFLEDPRVMYPNVRPAHHAPITGRFIGTTPGDAGPETGSLVKRLRLVE